MEEEMNGSEWNKSFREPASHPQDTQERARVLSSRTSWVRDHGGVLGFLSEVSVLKSRPAAPLAQRIEQRAEVRERLQTWRREALGLCALSM